MYMLYIWLAVLSVGLLVESLYAGTLISIWFSAGAIIPLIMSFWGITTPIYITIQVVIFGLVTLLCLIFLRKRLCHQKRKLTSPWIMSWTWR